MPGFPGPAPATAPGQRLGGEWAPGRGRGIELEVRPMGRGMWKRGGFRAAPRALPRSTPAPALTLLRAWGCPVLQTAVPRSPAAASRCWLRAPTPPCSSYPPLHLGQRTQPPAAPCTAPWTESCSRSPPAPPS